MSSRLCILNLTNNGANPEKPKSINLPAEIAYQGTSITSADDIPTDPNLILYVIAHAVPGGLIDPSGKVLDESELAKTIRAKRKALSTLIIWDACFAKSLLSIVGADVWPTNFVHIFSSQAFERAWHSDTVTLLSIELGKAIETLAKDGAFEWDALQKQLQERLSPIQHPEILPRTGLRAADFQLDLLRGAAAGASA